MYKRQVTLTWIKAHVGHEGNEAADVLAKNATTLIPTTETLRSDQINKHSLKEKMYVIWKNRWVIEPTCRQTKQFYPYPDPNKSKALLKLARSQLSLILKITTGHNALAYHASKIDNEIDPTCSLCGEADETFFHFVTDCPRLRLTRADKLLEAFNPESWEAEHLLAFAKTPVIEMLLSRT